MNEIKDDERFRAQLTNNIFRETLSVESIKSEKLKEKYSTECRRNGTILYDFDVYKIYKRQDLLNVILLVLVWLTAGILIGGAL
jgi:hypothetical protein